MGGSRSSPTRAPPLAELSDDVFYGEPTIGGRYSALSVFGLLPAALMGVDVGRLLDRAEEMREACRSSEGNPGLDLGLWLAEQQFLQVDADFGLWVEQLVAESTGKEGKGIVPVREGGEGPRSGFPAPTSSARSSSAGSSRRRSPARSSASTPSTSRTSRPRRTRPMPSFRARAE